MGYNIGNPLQARTGGYGSNLRVLLGRYDAWNAYDGYLACPSSGIPRARVFGGVPSAKLAWNLKRSICQTLLSKRGYMEFH